MSGSLQLPGADLVEAGLVDLARGVESAAALLVAIGAPPHTRATTRCCVGSSATSVRMRQLADSARIQQLMRALGRTANEPGRVYFTGGATAVLLGWRPTTIDVDLKLVPDQDAVLRAIPALKESLQLNVELAAPDDFIPVRPGWEDRGRFIAQEVRLAFYHFDFVAQALAKLERAHTQDLVDVGHMIEGGLIDRESLGREFAAIEPLLYRYPAIDPAAFKRSIAAFTEA